MKNSLKKYCVECGEDFCFTNQCRHCGCTDWENRDDEDVELSRTGGLDNDI